MSHHWYLPKYQPVQLQVTTKPRVKVKRTKAEVQVTSCPFHHTSRKRELLDLEWKGSDHMRRRSPWAGKQHKERALRNSHMRIHILKCTQNCKHILEHIYSSPVLQITIKTVKINPFPVRPECLTCRADIPKIGFWWEGNNYSGWKSCHSLCSALQSTRCVLQPQPWNRKGKFYNFCSEQVTGKWQARFCLSKLFKLCARGISLPTGQIHLFN